jgi:predicted DNA-binding transcriptional regulator AlpA
MVNDTAFAPERFMRCEEFCARCGISMPTLYGYWRQGIGPQSQKIGPKHRVILREDAEAWLRSHQAA